MAKVKLTIKRKGATFRDLEPKDAFLAETFSESVLCKLAVGDKYSAGYNAFNLSLREPAYVGYDEAITPVDVEEIIVWAD
jgi:hypothetical protein